MLIASIDALAIKYNPEDFVAVKPETGYKLNWGHENEYE